LSVDHHVTYGLAVANIGERICIEHYEVGQLALHDGTDVADEPKILGTGERGRPQRLERRPAALLQHPQLPVCTNSLKLTARAKLYLHSRIQQVLRSTRYVHVAVVLGRCHQAATRTRIQHTRRREATQPFVLPDLVVLVEPVFAVQSAVVDDQRWRVASLAG